MDNTVGEGTSVGREGSAPQPFYNESSQISDPKAAEDVAYVEKDQGRDAAILRENALREEHDTGLTERERKNLEIADMLVEEFPDAFVESVDDNGTKIFTTGLQAVQYVKVVSELRLLLPSRKEELLNDPTENILMIIREVRMHKPSDGREILNNLVDNVGNIYISKYGMSIGSEGEFNINNNQEFIHCKDSIRIFSDEELKTFFKALKFLDKVGKAKKELDKVGKTKKEMDVDKQRRERSVEDFRNLARQIKNS
jgi:hypothetical protein